MHGVRCEEEQLEVVWAFDAISVTNAESVRWKRKGHTEYYFRIINPFCLFSIISYGPI